MTLVPLLASGASMSLSVPALAAVPSPATISSSPTARGVQARAAREVAPTAITFGEFAVGTTVTDQYRSRGVVFDSSAFTVNDGSATTNPVLSGVPTFSGPVAGHFVEPGTTTPTTVSGVSLDVGYIDSRDSVELHGFDTTGRLVVTVVAQSLGFNRLRATYRGLASFSVETVGAEPAGFAVDNLDIVTAAAGIAPTRIASLGDSYSSGEGLLPEAGLRYDCGTDLLRGTYYRDTTMPSTSLGWSSGNDCDTRTGSRNRPADLSNRGFSAYQNKCHRHTRAYPNQIRSRLGVSGSNGLFIACSGAVTKDIGREDASGRLVSQAQYPLSPVNVAGGKSQLATLGDFGAGGAPGLITIGIGGNDAGFADIITQCALHACAGDESFKSGVLTNINSTTFTHVRDTLVTLRKRFPGSTIAAFGYPSVIGEPESGCSGFGLAPLRINVDERRWLRESVFPALNSAISDAAAEAGVTFVDISSVTEGHEICSGDPWINGLRGGSDDGFSPVGSESFHPNQKAHDAIATYFVNHLTQGGRLLFDNPEPSEPLRPELGTPIYVGHLAVSQDTPCGTDCLQPAACVQACTITVQGSNLAPRSRVTLTLHSDPVDLGEAYTDDDGAFTRTVTLPPGVPAGVHTVELSGVSPDGLQQLGTALVEVFDEAPPSRRPAPDPEGAPGNTSVTTCAASGTASGSVSTTATIVAARAGLARARAHLRKARRELRRAETPTGRAMARKRVHRAERKLHTATLALTTALAATAQGGSTVSVSTCRAGARP